MNEEIKLNLAIGVIRGLHAQNLITYEQMNLAINKVKLPIDKDICREIADRKPLKEGIKGDKSGGIL